MLKFLAKYRETGLLLFRASIGIIFLMLITPVLWSGQSAWSHFGAAMRNVDVSGHYEFWGFVGAVLGCVGGVLMVLGLFFRLGVLCALVLTLVHLVGVTHMHEAGLHAHIEVIEMTILLVSLLFIGPGKYSVDKG
jgi:putative oxidoreductase